MKLYHNPRCSKSRQTLALLEAEGHSPEVIRYLETPPDAATLDAICTALDCDPTALVRFKDDAAKSLGLSARDSRSRVEWLAVLAANPALIERPILVVGNRAVIGRPPEAVRSLL
jgi:arsenate reductase (glutaredoxin)